MGISSSISRVTEYHSRHGFLATIRRAGLAAKRAVFASRMVVFYCDLDERSLPPVNIPSSLSVERLGKQAEVNPQDLQEIISFWNPKIAAWKIKERFAKGSTLWLIKSDDRLAGYSWTIRGRAIAAYYFPMGPDDVQLFDFYVFPKFRGRAILWFLIAHILNRLGAEGAARIYGDVVEWNQASLSFYKMTPFRRLGVARSFTLFGRKFTCWADAGAEREPQKEIQGKDKALAVTRSHER